jgi:beta-galactosidase/beta-glucuronidase
LGCDEVGVNLIGDDMSIPRPEYPRPQFQRTDWLNLNGMWEFEIDPGDSGLERGMLERKLTGTITVPFCPESELSGIGHVDFMAAVWYRKVVKIPKKWGDRRTLLHFQAVDYDATIWVNGKEVARHRGGFTPITIDLHGIAASGEDVTIAVRARDDTRSPGPRGKQSAFFKNLGCHYTRTTGIWQTVWMEPVSNTYLKRPRITPDVAKGRFTFHLPMVGDRKGYSVSVAVLDASKEIVIATVAADADFIPVAEVVIPKAHRKLWSIKDPHLYDVKIELKNAAGKVVDTVASYAGLRGITIDGKAVKINGKTVFQRLVLDQGFYASGILTAPTDQALIDDIKLSMKAGFNGARLHQKVFEERFLYHADKLGYLCWGEFPDWGCNDQGPAGDNQQPTATYIAQWCEAIERDYSHPSIIGWCPLNETWQKITDKITALDDVTRGMFLATKAMDTTRPVLDASGYAHRVFETDIYDSHDYEQNPEIFKARHAGLADGNPYVNPDPDASGKKDIWSLPYNGQPYFVSEFGGIWWNPDAGPGEDSWGYGQRCKSLEEFFARFEGLCAALLDDPNMFGYCYTQLTDVFQEQNGIYRFNRQTKFDMKRIRAAQIRPAAIEKLK